MRTVQEIYDEYDIMPNLQLHQLRVAAVAKIIGDSIGGGFDTKGAVIACLFHDMGNIIKSDLEYFPEFLKPRGLEFWRGVKDRFIAKYGKDEKAANEAIAQELRLPEEALTYLANMGFANAEKNSAGRSLETKVCNYADMRVGPHGVMSMEARMAEGRDRYKARKHAISSDPERFEAMANALRSIEKDIFSRTEIRPDQITDDEVNSMMEGLRAMRI